MAVDFFGWHTSVMESSASRKTRATGLGIASIMLLCNGIPMVLAAVVNIMFVRTLVAISLGLLLAAIGAATIAAAIRLHAGIRVWWIAALGLVPIGAAAQFFDAYVFGNGRIPIVWGIIIPVVALVSLLLPSVKRGLQT